LSGIPEFRRVKEEGPQLPPIRRAAGIIGLIAGILMALGYLLLAVTVFLGIGLIVMIAGSLHPSLVMLGALAADIGVLALAIGIYSLLAGLRGRRGHPGSIASSITALWAALLMVMFSLGIVAAAVSGVHGLRMYTPLIVGLVGSVLVLIAAFTVRPGTSFGAWLAGSSMGLTGLIMLIISKYMGAQPTLQIRDIPVGVLGEIATLTYTPVLVGGIIASAALILAPFIGSRRAWISEMIGAVGAIVGAASLTYIAITGIEPIYRIYEMSSIAWGDIADLMKAIGITGTASLALITAASIIGIIALIFAIIHLATSHKQQVVAQPPPPSTT